jgi:hypothetical protein
MQSKVASLDQSSVPVAILQTALSHDPAERPPLASALLSELDAIEAKWTAAARPSWGCHIRIDADCLRRVLKAIDRNDPSDGETFILEELNEIEVGLKIIPGTEGSDEKLRISAVTWTFEAHRSSMNVDFWSVRRAWSSRPADVERYRELCFRAPLRFTLAAPNDHTIALEETRELLLQIKAFEQESREQALALRRERVFRLWYSFLRNKADYEESRESAIVFVDVKLTDKAVTLTAELPITIEAIGQSRVIRTGSGGHVFCDIIDVNLQEASVLPRMSTLWANSILPVCTFLHVQIYVEDEIADLLYGPPSVRQHRRLLPG